MKLCWGRLLCEIRSCLITLTVDKKTLQYIETFGRGLSRLYSWIRALIKKAWNGILKEKKILLQNIFFNICTFLKISYNGYPCQSSRPYLHVLSLQNIVNIVYIINVSVKNTSFFNVLPNMNNCIRNKKRCFLQAFYSLLNQLCAVEPFVM